MGSAGLLGSVSWQKEMFEKNNADNITRKKI